MTTPPLIDPVFQARREVWIRALSSNDINSIFRQVYRMIWDAASYRVVLEGRRLADKDDRGRLRLNGLTHHLLDRCFFHSQAATVRRLMDSTYGLEGKRGVYSLGGLIKDMREHRDRFTRRNLFAAAGRSMDLEAARRAEREWFLEHVDKDDGCLHYPTTIDPYLIEDLHKLVDTLCKSDASRRSPHDTVCATVFNALDEKLAETDDLCEHVNKYIAHAATPESRKPVEERIASLQFEEVWHAHETICRACQFIDLYLLTQTGHSFLGIRAGDVFKYIDRPLVRADQVGALRDAWATYASETRRWADDTEKWLFRPS